MSNKQTGSLTNQSSHQSSSATTASAQSGTTKQDACEPDQTATPLISRGALRREIALAAQQKATELKQAHSSKQDNEIK